MIALDSVKHLKVPKEMAQKEILKLRKSGYFLEQYEIKKDGENVLIPVNSNYEHGESVILESVKRDVRVQPSGHAGAFDQIGEIAIIHDRRGIDKDRIANSILISKPNIRTIYLDKGINGEFRLRELQILRGEDDPVTEYRENNILMTVNVKKVYFSPRLSTERLLLSKSVSNGENIFDMFCGLGPVTLNIAKVKNCNIVSCDINPEAINLLEQNIAKNKLLSNIETLNGDSYKTIKKFDLFDRIIMNNPVNRYQNLDLVLEHLKNYGILNIYFVEDQEGIGKVMEELKAMNLEIQRKRVVHGYSTKRSLYSLEFRWLE